MKFYYLATPYSRYPAGQDAAFVEACEAVATLMRRGLHVFSPIAHSHPVAEHGGLDPLCADIWLPLDLAVLEKCSGMIVLKMPGWDKSDGVRAEIAHAMNHGVPITYLTWPLRGQDESFGDLQPSG